MKNKILAVILFTGLCAIFSNINGQQKLVRIDKPFVAKNLSGTIINANGEKMPFVIVKRFTSDWKNEIESVETSIDGKFNFKKLPPGTYYLRISAAYFNELEVKVRLQKNSKAKLRFKLEVST